MALIVCLGSLAVLIILAYRGFRVILVAPLAAMAAVLLTDPSAVAPAFSGLFMEKLGSFVKLYFPIFLLGAMFGKLIEVSGAAGAIAGGVTRLLGPGHAVLAITVVGMVLTYGGVSVFVVVFATYPFAVELFRRADIPKRLIPAIIAFSAFTITMDALPDTPQIQNIIPTTFFRTTAYAAPQLSVAAATFTFLSCLAYLRWRQVGAARRGEGYGAALGYEPCDVEGGGRRCRFGWPWFPSWSWPCPTGCFSRSWSRPTVRRRSRTLALRRPGPRRSSRM